MVKIKLFILIIYLIINFINQQYITLNTQTLRASYIEPNMYLNNAVLLKYPVISSLKLLNPFKGQLYYDNNLNTLDYYNGNQWIQCGTSTPSYCNFTCDMINNFYQDYKNTINNMNNTLNNVIDYQVNNPNRTFNKICIGNGKTDTGECINSIFNYNNNFNVTDILYIMSFKNITIHAPYIWIEVDPNPIIELDKNKDINNYYNIKKIEEYNKLFNLDLDISNKIKYYNQFNDKDNILRSELPRIRIGTYPSTKIITIGTPSPIVYDVINFNGNVITGVENIQISNFIISDNLGITGSTSMRKVFNKELNIFENIKITSEANTTNNGNFTSKQINSEDITTFKNLNIKSSDDINEQITLSVRTKSITASLYNDNIKGINRIKDTKEDCIAYCEYTCHIEWDNIAAWFYPICYAGCNIVCLGAPIIANVIGKLLLSENGNNQIINNSTRYTGLSIDFITNHHHNNSLLDTNLFITSSTKNIEFNLNNLINVNSINLNSINTILNNTDLSINSISKRINFNQNTLYNITDILLFVQYTNDKKDNIINYIKEKIKNNNNNNEIVSLSEFINTSTNIILYLNNRVSDLETQVTGLICNLNCTDFNNMNTQINILNSYINQSLLTTSSPEFNNIKIKDTLEVNTITSFSDIESDKDLTFQTKGNGVFRFNSSSIETGDMATFYSSVKTGSKRISLGNDNNNHLSFEYDYNNAVSRINHRSDLFPDIASEIIFSEKNVLGFPGIILNSNYIEIGLYSWTSDQILKIGNNLIRRKANSNILDITSGIYDIFSSSSGIEFNLYYQTGLQNVISINPITFGISNIDFHSVHPLININSIKLLDLPSAACDINSYGKLIFNSKKLWLCSLDSTGLMYIYYEVSLVGWTQKEEKEKKEDIYKLESRIKELEENNKILNTKLDYIINKLKLK